MTTPDPAQPGTPGQIDDASTHGRSHAGGRALCHVWVVEQETDLERVVTLVPGAAHERQGPTRGVDGERLPGPECGERRCVAPPLEVIHHAGLRGRRAQGH